MEGEEEVNACCQGLAPNPGLGHLELVLEVMKGCLLGLGVLGFAEGGEGGVEVGVLGIKVGVPGGIGGIPPVENGFCGVTGEGK